MWALKNKAKCAQHQRVSIKRVTRAWSLCRETQVCPGSGQLWPGLSISSFFSTSTSLVVQCDIYSLDMREVGNCCLGKSMRQEGPNVINGGTSNHHIRFQTSRVRWSESVLPKASIADTAEHSYINLLLLSSQFPKSFQGVETSFSLIHF